MNTKEYILRSELIEGNSKVIISFGEQLASVMSNFVFSRGGTEEDLKDLINTTIAELVVELRQNKISSNTQSIYRAYFIARRQWSNEQDYRKKIITKAVSPMEIIQLEKVTEEVGMVNPYKQAIVKIDKEWSAKEFGNLLLNIDAIYQIKIFFILSTSISSRKINTYLRDYDKIKTTSDFDLTVTKIRYGSPGSIDIFGIGEALKQVKEFIFSSLKFRQEYRETEIDMKIKIEELRAKRLENLEKFLELTEKSNLPMTTMNKMAEFIDPKQEDIVHLLEAGKIKDIEIEETL